MLLRLLTLLALLVAPFATPAAAMARAAPMTAVAECEAAAVHSSGDAMPMDEQERIDPCCTAVVAAINSRTAILAAVEALAHLPFLALADPFALGANPQADDPPPRSV